MLLTGGAGVEPVDADQVGPVTTTAVSGAATDVSAWIYRVATALLVALATLTALTGARTRVIWFKICPVLLTGSAALLVIASFV